MAEKPTYVVTKVEQFDQPIDWSKKWATLLVYNVDTESGQIVLKFTVPAANQIRSIPDKLPPDLTRSPGFGKR
jgi:hypothetical protein